MMQADDCVYIAGHNGLAGSAILRFLKSKSQNKIIFQNRTALDLTDQYEVKRFFSNFKPKHVVLAAAKVGGIKANATFPADFINLNLQIQQNVINSAFESGVDRLVFLGSSCIYPRDCPQPIKEEYLLSGYLEHTNRAYAVAKIAGIEMCSAFNQQYGTNYIALMPTNLYGPGDNYDPFSSHVLAATIRKFIEAQITGQQKVIMWGTGTPRREFLHSDDLASACHFILSLSDLTFKDLIDKTSPPIINVGTGLDITIKELAHMVADIVEYDGEIEFDSSFPDGTPRKLLDVSQINSLGWKAQIPLRAGISAICDKFFASTQSPIFS
jgi:GDP-L-fucose synthase